MPLIRVELFDYRVNEETSEKLIAGLTDALCAGDKRRAPRSHMGDRRGPRPEELGCRRQAVAGGGHATRSSWVAAAAGRGCGKHGYPQRVAARDDIRNVAIVAHVDHGKTTLVDAMLWQSGVVPREPGRRRARHGLDGPRAREGHHDPREEHRRPLRRRSKINIIDTPGHADFGGEVERGLRWSTACCCSSMRARGRCRRRGSCCARRWRRACRVVLVVNKVDRPDARIAEVVDEVYELFLDLDADESQIEFPIVYCNAKAGPRRARRPDDARQPTCEPLFDLLLETIPAPVYDEGASAAGARHQPRRVAVRRPAGALPRPQRHDPQGPAGRLVSRRRQRSSGSR